METNSGHNLTKECHQGEAKSGTDINFFTITKRIIQRSIEGKKLFLLGIIIVINYQRSSILFCLTTTKLLVYHGREIAELQRLNKVSRKQRENILLY